MNKPSNAPTVSVVPAAERRRRGLVLRISVLTILLFLGAGKVLHRAYEIQVKHPQDYARHYREEIDVEQKRGNIYDRHGAELAVSVDLDSYFADPVVTPAQARADHGGLGSCAHPRHRRGA
jgi:cell division protein FtsI/penicillin-binding protein 2